MDLEDLDLGEFMHDAARSGITMMLKIDHERTQSGGKSWTVLLSGSRLGGSTVVRWDLWTLTECIQVVVETLREIPGDWEWLDLYF
jgi:hypothetical protein